MVTKKIEPTRAECLAAVITGDASTRQIMSTIQRSHRFPSHILCQIENLATMAKAPVSLIINELLACGLDSVKDKLPEDIIDQMTIMTSEQASRTSVMDSTEVNARNSAARRKLKKGK